MNEQPHLNPGGHLPPVDCPLVIELETGVLVQAHRQRFVKNRKDNPEYHLADGSVLEGRYRWTYP